MGVPGFFGWLLRHYKENKIIKQNLDDPINILYVDANCLIHPQCRIIMDNCPTITDIEKLEYKMLQRVENYLNYLFAFCGPSDEFYIAVDGSAPLAKINQQRRRRIRAIEDNDIRNNIKKKYGVKTNNVWNNTKITPGTEFMEKLHNHMLKYIEELSKRNPNVKITYSSYHTSGEGEHKILEDIRQKSTDGSFNEKNVAIYGLDADLIFLSLASQKKNIFLLREALQLGKGGPTEIFDPVSDVAEELLYVSIDDMKRCYGDQIVKSLIYKKQGITRDFNEEMRNEIVKKELEHYDTEINKFVNDFIVLCYFLGNDFIPNFPSIDITFEGLDMLIDAYVDTYLTYNMHLITDEKTLNQHVILEITRLLGDIEEEYFCEIKPRIDRRLSKKRCQSNNPLDIELWRLDNLRNIEVYDPIQYGFGEKSLWKFRYYEHYYGTSEYQTDLIKKMCYNYLEGLVWVTQYYFKGCCSWTWQYKYSHAPFVSDLFKYLDEFSLTDINQIPFSRDIPLVPCTQLLAVLPMQCSEELPVKYRHLVKSIDSPIIDLFPIKVSLDLINKDLLWKGIPLMPYLDIKRILDAVDKIKLDNNEQLRNKVLENFVYIKKH